MELRQGRANGGLCLTAVLFYQTFIRQLCDCAVLEANAGAFQFLKKEKKMGD
jgi:hypothetical protein